MSVSRIRKARTVRGKLLEFRNAEVADAEFIFELRTDSVKSRHLSAIDGGVQGQRDWLGQYSQRQDQAYFVIESAGQPIGTVRLYDARGASFCWGSWVLSERASPTAAIESALMVYAFAIEQLHFEEAHFDVRKDNEKVWRFHERFGASRSGETDKDYLYRISGESIGQAREHYSKYLPNAVQVTWL